VTLRVLIADDHPIFRAGLRALLATVQGAELVGEAATGDEALEQIERLQPDVVLMDLQMPGRNGIETTRLVRDRHPGVGVLVLTMFEDDDSIFAAMRAGARGYLLKEADGDELARAIEAVGHGQAIFGPSVARRVMSFFAAAGSAARAALPFPELTEREREVLEHIAQGRNNSDIARRLGLRQKTVRNHVSNILNKLQVVDRAQAIVRAREAGLGGSAPGGPGRGDPGRDGEQRPGRPRTVDR
jgi:DNA-binding NarL/FixJ family response regulator